MTRRTSRIVCPGGSRTLAASHRLDRRGFITRVTRYGAAGLATGLLPDMPGLRGDVWAQQAQADALVETSSGVAARCHGNRSETAPPKNDIPRITQPRRGWPSRRNPTPMSAPPLKAKLRKRIRETRCIVDGHVKDPSRIKKMNETTRESRPTAEGGLRTCDINK